MRSLLRHPGIVPSLFSDGIDGDVSSAGGRSLPHRAVALVSSGFTLLGWHRNGSVLNRRSAVVGNLTALVLGRPLPQAFLVGDAGPR